MTINSLLWVYDGAKGGKNQSINARCAAMGREEIVDGWGPVLPVSASETFHYWDSFKDFCDAISFQCTT
jgi:hypothetical protein